MRGFRGEALIALLFSIVAILFYGMSQIELGKEVSMPQFPNMITSDTQPRD